MGIFGAGQGGDASGGATGLPGNLPPVDIFGNYGNLGKTGVIANQNISINVEGSIISDQDLMNMIRQEFIKLQNRNSTTGIK